MELNFADVLRDLPRSRVPVVKEATALGALPQAGVYLAIAGGNGRKASALIGSINSS